MKPCKAIFTFSSLYAFYYAFYNVDLNEVYSVEEKLALDAAYFKLGASHIALSLFILPGSSLIFGRFLFRLKHWRRSALGFILKCSIKGLYTAFYYLILVQ